MEISQSKTKTVRRTKKTNAKPEANSALDKASIVLDSALTIQCVSDLKPKFMSLLESKGSVCIDCSAIETADTAGLQLLTVFNREMRSRGLEVRWINPAALRNVANILDLSKQLELPA